MWREARKQERITKKLIIDHKKRAERRRENVTRNRLDPTTLLQIHGTKAKINIDSTIYQYAASNLMPWQGDTSNMIDRFDIRTSLDSIPVDHLNSTKHSQSGAKNQSTTVDIDVSSTLRQQLNYERYRVLIQDGIMDVAEERRLQLIKKNDFVKSTRPLLRVTHNRSGDKPKSNSVQPKAAIGLDYRLLLSSAENPSSGSRGDELSQTSDTHVESYSSQQSIEETRLSNDSELSDIEVDDIIDIDAVSLQRVDEISKRFGLVNGCFKELVDKDKREEERLRKSKEDADSRQSLHSNLPRHERRHFHGRLFRDEQYKPQGPARRNLDAERNDNTNDVPRSPSTSSSSRSSNSPTNVGREFITSIARDEEEKKDLVSSPEVRRVNMKSQTNERSSRSKNRKRPVPEVVYGPAPAPKSLNSNVLNLEYSSSSDSSPVRQRSRSQSIPRRPTTDVISEQKTDDTLESSSRTSPQASPISINFNTSDAKRPTHQLRDRPRGRSRRPRRRSGSSRSSRPSFSRDRRYNRRRRSRSSQSSSSSSATSSSNTDNSKSSSSSSSSSLSSSSSSSISSGSNSIHKTDKVHENSSDSSTSYSRRYRTSRSSRRRSPTPLAYKRHKRSNRSVTREIRRRVRHSKRSRSRS